MGWVGPTGPDLRTPVVASLCVLCTVLAVAGASGNWLAAVAAVLFVASDSMIAWGKFVAPFDAAPVAITTSLHIAEAGDPVSYEAVVLGPSSDEVLSSGFDSAVPTSATPVVLDWSK